MNILNFFTVILLDFGFLFLIMVQLAHHGEVESIFYSLLLRQLKESARTA